MSDEVTIPQRAPSGASGTIARLGARNGKLKAAIGRLTEERDAVKAALATTQGQLGDLEKRADTSASAKRVLELEGQLREIAHRKVFDRVARARGVADDRALEDLYQLSGYRAEAEAADEAAIGALVDAQKRERGYLFGTPEPPPANGSPPPRPGPASDQGARPGTPALAQFGGEGDERINDVKYVMQNYDKITAAAQERIARGEI